jgi:hypothetical protein
VDWAQFWIAAGTIGQLLAAAATFYTARVALRVARQASGFNIRTEAYARREQIELAAFNIGQRDCHLCKLLVKLPNGKEIEVPTKGENFPGWLRQQEHANVTMTLDVLGRKLVASDVDGDDTIWFYFLDATGNKHWCPRINVDLRPYARRGGGLGGG